MLFGVNSVTWQPAIEGCITFAETGLATASLVTFGALLAVGDDEAVASVRSVGIVLLQLARDCHNLRWKRLWCRRLWREICAKEAENGVADSLELALIHQLSLG